jgi:flagellar basal-body rod modification protein FlgD
MTSTVNMAAAANSASKTNSSTVKLAEDFTQFLTLLTTQLQNQDPLSPMDSTEFTNQLVQFTQVEQSINTNAKLDSLVQMQMASMVGIAMGYVGMDITYPSVELNFDGETSPTVTYALPEDAYVAKINIRDETGKLIFNGDVSKLAGTQTFKWDGRDNDGNLVEPGTYNFTIDAVNSEEKAMTVSTAVTGRVRGVESQNGVPHLLVGDRAIAMGNVINTSIPKVAAATPTDPTPPAEETTDPENEAEVDES